VEAGDRAAKSRSSSPFPHLTARANPQVGAIRERTSKATAEASNCPRVISDEVSLKVTCELLINRRGDKGRLRERGHRRGCSEERTDSRLEGDGCSAHNKIHQLSSKVNQLTTTSAIKAGRSNLVPLLLCSRSPSPRAAASASERQLSSPDELIVHLQYISIKSTPILLLHKLLPGSERLLNARLRRPNVCSTEICSTRGSAVVLGLKKILTAVSRVPSHHCERLATHSWRCSSEVVLGRALDVECSLSRDCERQGVCQQQL